MRFTRVASKSASRPTALCASRTTVDQARRQGQVSKKILPRANIEFGGGGGAGLIRDACSTASNLSTTPRAIRRERHAHRAALTLLYHCTKDSAIISHAYDEKQAVDSSDEFTEA